MLDQSPAGNHADFDDRYGGDPIARMRERKSAPLTRKVAMASGMWLEDAATGFYGRLASANKQTVTLQDFDGQRKAFPADSIFLLDDEPVLLGPPAAKQPAGRARSASGSFHVADAKARTARAGRIFVEGKHDAELVEKVWGHDLRIDGVVVEFLQGADHLAEVLTVFGPSSTRRVGVLLDHLVKGSKEQRIADDITRRFGASHVRVVGHPYVDVWQSVKPERLGLTSWPVIPRGQDWKKGICRALGWPAEEQADTARAWQRILERVRDYRDLEPSLLGRVEELIDFVTEPGGAGT